MSSTGRKFKSDDILRTGINFALNVILSQSREPSAARSGSDVAGSVAGHGGKRRISEMLRFHASMDSLRSPSFAIAKGYAQHDKSSTCDRAKYSRAIDYISP